MTRRDFLETTASTLALSPFARWTPPRKSKKMGVSIASYAIRWRSEDGSKTYPGFTNALQVLEHCKSLDAGGLQTSVRGWSQDFAGKVRDAREKLGLYLEGQISLPKDDTDIDRFSTEVKHAKEAGADIIRAVCLSGRRYETFKSFESWTMFMEQSMRAMERAEPVMRRHKVKLAIENHKDWRIDELIEIMEHLGSEWMGVTLDTGNNMSLLEDPMTVVEKLAPYSFTTHFKDMAVESYEDGFLLSEVPLGRGVLNLPKVISLCERHNPEITFNLEMITRDPLKIPCLTDNFWETFMDVNGKDLAQMLRLVRETSPDKPLPKVSNKNPEERLAFEEENNRLSFDYAKEHLSLQG